MKNEIEAKKDSGPSDRLKMSSPLASRALFWPARYRRASEFLHHMPLAFWLTDVVQPHTLVEVGLDTGQSYFGFCQAMERLNTVGRCYGFSEAAPDDALLNYNNENYEEFSTIVERAAVEALRRFKDESIDFLIVNGALPDETLRSLRDVWGRKLSKRAVLLVHNYLTTPHEAAVQDMIDELEADHGVITFEKGHGVAVILYGSQQDERLEHLARINFGSPEYNIVHSVFGRLGSAHYYEWSSGKFAKDAQAANRKAKQALDDRNAKQEALERAQDHLTALQAAYEARSDKIAEMQVSLFDGQQKHLTEVADLRKQVHSLQDALTQEKAARETEQKRADDAVIAREKALEDATAKQGEIETLAASLEEAQAARGDLAAERDKALNELALIKTAHSDEIVALTNKLVACESELRDMGAACEQERQSAGELKLALEAKQQDVNARAREIETLTASLKEAEAARDQVREELALKKTVHTDEVVALTNKLVACESELQKKATAYAQEHQRAGELNDALEAKAQVSKASEQKIETLTASLEETMTLRDKALQEAEEAKKVNAKEIAILVQNLEDQKAIILEAKTEHERERHNFRTKIQTLEIDLGKTIERNEFDKRYLQIQVRLRDRLIEKLRSRGRIAFAQRLTGKDLRKEHAHIVANSPKFDADWYLATYPDVKESGMDPALHFVSNGFYEGRSPSPDFDCIAYIIEHPEVLENDINPVVHAARNDPT